MSTYEVEQKFPIDDVPQLETRLEALDIFWQPAVAQADQYLKHPVRNFAETDEALRIRSVGDQACLTYKGPKIDRVTKTRREIEIPLAVGADAERILEIFETLGFARSGKVQKRRRSGTLQWHGQSVNVAVDRVEQLGDFVELEVTAGAEELDGARALILTLAEHLNLSNPERRGYLQMVMGKGDVAPAGGTTP